MATKAHPKFIEELLPDHLGVRMQVHNVRGARKIVIAEVYDLGANSFPPIALGSGHAICAPVDKFDMSRGEQIATGRAIRDWYLAGSPRNRLDPPVVRGGPPIDNPPIDDPLSYGGTFS